MWQQSLRQWPTDHAIRLESGEVSVSGTASYSVHDIRVFEETPNIYHRFALEIRFGINGVRSAQDQDITVRDHVVEGQNVRICCYEGIGYENFVRTDFQSVFE